jgi:hypothetical protein
MKGERHRQVIRVRTGDGGYRIKFGKPIVLTEIPLLD